MKVRITAYGSLREMLGIPRPGEWMELELPDGSTVGQAVEGAGLPAELVRHILIDGERASASASLAEGSELTLMPAFTGGGS